MTEESQTLGFTPLTSKDYIQKKIIDSVFSAFDAYCKKDELISEHSSETVFTRHVHGIKALLWKYMPDEMRQKINEYYDELDENTKSLKEENPEMDDKNININKRLKENNTAAKVLELCMLALQYSPVVTELKQINVFKEDFEKLIEKTRSEKAFGIFSEVEELEK